MSEPLKPQKSWKGPGPPEPKVLPDDPLGVSTEDLDAIMRANEEQKRDE